MPNTVKLIAQKSTRQGYEMFYDLYAVWEYNGKTTWVRLRPQFPREMKYLMAHALVVPSGEPVEKYL